MGQAHSGPNLMTGFLWRRRKTVVVDHEGNIDADAAKKIKRLVVLIHLSRYRTQLGKYWKWQAMTMYGHPKAGPMF